MSIAQKNRIRTQNEIDRMGQINKKKIGLYDSDENLIQQWGSIEECRLEIKISRSYIQKILKGSRKPKNLILKLL